MQKTRLDPRDSTQKQARKLLDEALLMENAKKIRLLFSDAIDQAGLNLYVKQ